MWMLYECFRATGAYEAVQGLSDLFTISFQNDDVQDFDVRWDHGLLSVSEMPSDMILERIVQVKNTGLCSSWLSTIQKPFETMDRQKLFTIEDVCKTSY